jgi:polar amino acid transport system substrate-binding protein
MTAIHRAAASLGLALAVAVPAHAADLDLRTEEYPPANFTGADGEITGIATEVVRRAADRANLSITIELSAFKRGLKATKTRPGTCFFGLWRTEQREDSFAWVGPLMQDGYALFARADSDIQLDELDDSFGYATGAVEGWGSTQAVKEAGHPNLEMAYEDSANMKRLEAGRIDLWLSGLLSAPYKAKAKGLDIDEKLLVNTVDLSVACHPETDRAVLDQLQNALDAMKSDGAVAKIQDRYL